MWRYGVVIANSQLTPCVTFLVHSVCHSPKSPLMFRFGSFDSTLVVNLMEGRRMPVVHRYLRELHKVPRFLHGEPVNLRRRSWILHRGLPEGPAPPCGRRDSASGILQLRWAPSSTALHGATGPPAEAQRAVDPRSHRLVRRRGCSSLTPALHHLGMRTATFQVRNRPQSPALPRRAQYLQRPDSTTDGSAHQHDHPADWMWFTRHE